jgi:hypothetical protein
MGMKRINLVTLLTAGSEVIYLEETKQDHHQGQMPIKLTGLDNRRPQSPTYLTIQRIFERFKVIYLQTILYLRGMMGKEGASRVLVQII